MNILIMFLGIKDWWEGFWDSNIGGVFSDLAFKIEEFWRQLLLSLCNAVYKFIVYLYDLFNVIGTAEILNSELLNQLYNRVGLLLGLYMFFRLVFSFIQMLLNPDYISDKEKGVGNIAKKALLVVVLLGVTPFLFEKAIEFQSFIVRPDSPNESVLAKLVLPNKKVFNNAEDFGSTLSAYMFTNFYRYNEIILNEEKPDGVRCGLLDPFQESTDGSDNISYLHIAIEKSRGQLSVANYCLNKTFKINEGEIIPGEQVLNKEKPKDFVISFTSDGVFALIAGLVVCYILGTYTIMAGTRVIQLAFFRIIAPMAILSYLSPKKETMFEKWLKMCGTTYIDLFIRIAIIYFVVYLTSVIMSTGVALQTDFDNMWLVNLIMIIALLFFAKKAPELLKELFPKSSAASLGFGLKSPKAFINDMAGGAMVNKGFSKMSNKAIKSGKWLARGSLGFAGGLVLGAGTGLIGSDKRLRGTLGGALRGGFTGIRKGGIKKVVGKQKDINNKYRELHEDGGNWFDVQKSKLKQTVGLSTKGQKNEKVMTAYDNIEKTNKSLSDYSEGEMMKTNKPGIISDYKNEKAKLDILRASAINIKDYKIKDKNGKESIDYKSYEDAMKLHSQNIANQEDKVNKMRKEAIAAWENDNPNNAVVNSYVEQMKSYAKTASIDYDAIANEKIIDPETGAERYRTLSEIMKTIKDRAEEGKAELTIDEDYIKQKAADKAAGNKS